MVSFYAFQVVRERERGGDNGMMYKDTMCMFNKEIIKPALTTSRPIITHLPWQTTN